MTDPTSLDLDSHPLRLWFWNFSLNELKGSLRLRNLHSMHFSCHIFLSPSSFRKTRLEGTTGKIGIEFVPNRNVRHLAREWSELGSRDIDHRTRATRVR